MNERNTADEIVECGPLGTVTVPGDWIDMITYYSDFFRTDHCGYWAMSVRLLDGTRLVYEHADDRPSQKKIDAAANAHRNGRSLPERWFLFDNAFAIKAYLEGIKLYGAGFYEDGDASDYDNAIQMAALGEVRYG